MAFMMEDVPESGPTSLAKEHWMLVEWVKASRVGVVEYLRHRMIDPVLLAALYYIEGFGMGDGKLFALVRGDAIYVAYVRWGNALWVGSPSVGHVQEVSFPESTPMSRGAIEGLFTDALGDYFEAHSVMNRYTWEDPGGVTFDWNATRWVVRPRKYSLLYWRSKFAKRWGGFRARLWPQIWTFISSPLVAALSLTALDWTGNRWPMVLVGVWLVLRLSQYEAHWRLGDWMIGRKKFRDPLEIFRILGRLQESPPLTALTVRVEPVEGDAMARLVRVFNRSWVPVTFVSISADALADLLAPGLIAQMRREAGQGGIDMKEVERMFPSMTKRWLWPLQSFERRYHLLDGFPSSTRPSRIKATVSISRLVSGEPSRGLAFFLLEVEDAEPSASPSP